MGKAGWPAGTLKTRTTFSLKAPTEMKQFIANFLLINFSWSSQFIIIHAGKIKVPNIFKKL